MHKQITMVSLFFLTMLPCTASVQAQDTRESELVDALRLNDDASARRGNSGKAIRAYMRDGYVGKKPDRRADYTDYYVLKKPATIMGHDLLLIEEEYMSRYIGCCVSPGAGVTVKINGSAINLEKFAQKNACRLSKFSDLRQQLQNVGIVANFPAGHYASLSCRERDAR